MCSVSAAACASSDLSRPEVATSASVPINESDPYQFAAADLKLIRRVAYRRYAFGLACEASRRLQGLGDSRLWLAKDLTLLRIGLALPVGYAVMLDKPSEWIWVIGRTPQLWIASVLGCCLFTWFLIYTNVRDQIGRTPSLTIRSIIAFLIGLAWCALYLMIGWVFAKVSPELRPEFELKSAILLSVSSYAITILVQFFFSRSGSIADPL